MTIPEKPLVLEKFDLNDLTLGEMAMFDTDEVGMGTANKLRKFLIAHTSWTAAEVNAITVGEIKTIGDQLTEELKRQAVPLASSTSSRTGPGSTRKHHRRSGSLITATPRSSAATRKTSPGG